MIARPFALALAALGLAGGALAHHGWGNYDAARKFTIASPVERLQWQNPHVHIFVRHEARTWEAVLADLKDERFQKVHDRIRTWFSYTLAEENVAAGPWSSRTRHYPHWAIEKEGPFAWKGLPGPDFTVSVNGAVEKCESPQRALSATIACSTSAAIAEYRAIRLAGDRMPSLKNSFWT